MHFPIFWERCCIWTDKAVKLSYIALLWFYVTDNKPESMYTCWICNGAATNGLFIL